MVTLHDSVAQIYERSGHQAWAARSESGGSSRGRMCEAQGALRISREDDTEVP